MLAIVVLFAAFWIWALFFASKESINGIGDDDWTDRAQAICEAADAERQDLADFREVDDDPAMLAERGDIVDRATDILERMLDDVVAVQPTGAKGAELVPLWEADYRTYLEDRREFSDDLRAGQRRAVRRDGRRRHPDQREGHRSPATTAWPPAPRRPTSAELQSSRSGPRSVRG